MSSYVSGVTFVVTNDNILFPFSTDFLLMHPINSILNCVVGFSLYNGVKVIRIDLSSTDIQTYMIVVTGFTLSSLCYYNEQTTIGSMTDICYKGDGLDILDDDAAFADFDNFVNAN